MQWRVEKYQSNNYSNSKKTKNRWFLKNWRPISLLNTDYKILTKILANRLKKVLPSIINTDQSGYLERRLIGQNIRLLEDIDNNIESTVINNGNTSKYFQLERGVRKGCPLSAYLFIMVIETLANKVKSDCY